MFFVFLLVSLVFLFSHGIVAPESVSVHCVSQALTLDVLSLTLFAFLLVFLVAHGIVAHGIVAHCVSQLLVVRAVSIALFSEKNCVSQFTANCVSQLLGDFVITAASSSFLSPCMGTPVRFGPNAGLIVGRESRLPFR
jgi:hypothetical protein